MTKTQIALRFILVVVWAAFVGIVWSTLTTAFNNGHGLGWPTYLFYGAVIGFMGMMLVFITPKWWSVKELPPL